ncbi:MAG: 2OG-Fe(II) oxygenase [Sphingosinicella sp.]|uniref:2OG-Fe(II) oxygenase n=1 Tax=Sphingosinicella sp. TaxID=1917971 RepID=UPI004037E877
MSSLSPARRAVALAGEGRVAEALALLAESGAAGDGEALFARGLWRVDGRLLPRELEAARADFRLAAELGSRDAARVYAGFVASGIGGPRDWASALALLAASDDPLLRRQHELIAAMDLTEDGNPRSLPSPEVLRDSPAIAVTRRLFTPEECRLLVELAEARFKPASIFHEARKQFVRDPLRDSDAAGFPVVLESPFVHALNRRLAAASGTDVAQGETLQILRYAPGQQYRPHLDAVPGVANQRILTALVWLNDDCEGGETLFLESGLAVKGGQGDLLLFANALPDGRPDPATRHAGAPVTRGVKLIASRWIRARPAGPEGFGRHEAEGH